MMEALRRKSHMPGALLIRLALIPALLLGLLVVGSVSVRFRPELLLVLTATPLLTLLVLKRPELSVPAITLTALSVRFSLPTGTQSRIVASLLLTAACVVLWVGRMLVVEKRLHLKPSRANAPLLCFVAVTVISYVWSNAFRDPLVVVWETWPFVQLGGLAVMALLPGAFLLASNTLTDVMWIKVLTGIFLGAGILATLRDCGLVRLGLLQVHPLFPTWFACLALAQGLFNRRLPLTLRVVLLSLVGIYGYHQFIVKLSWLVAWAPTLLGMLAVCALRSRLLFAVLLIVVVAFVAANLGDARAAYGLERSISGLTRLAAYVQNWRVTGKHLLFGVGPAGYAVYYMSYFPEQAMATHSNYLDVLSQTGVIGLLAFLAFFLALGLTARDLLARTRGRFDFSHAFAVATAGGLVGTIVAMGLGDWVLPFVYTQTIAGFDYAVYTWVLLGAAQALNHLLVHEECGVEA